MVTNVVSHRDWVVLVVVDFLILLQHLVRYVHQPVGGLVAFTALSLVEHCLFVDYLHPDVVVLPPDILVVVLDEGVVVAALGASIVDAHRMQLVAHELEVLVHLVEVGLLHCDLLLELLDLLRRAFLHLLDFGHELRHDLLHVSSRRALVERKESFHV